ncbi:hypothetical protein AcetOrient_orf00611 [Acetobacter orientalis]|uniref:Uncharacterized protein n=1 Tax=Acetobacter orientalis TaxID=146474 RepID=A0A2Z5ZEB9_9PROT|nr:hypothetical protein AcetOrient_orf00611 [Acetobacter orientalis]
MKHVIHPSHISNPSNIYTYSALIQKKNRSFFNLFFLFDIYMYWMFLPQS